MFEDSIMYEDDSMIVIKKAPYYPVQSAKVTRPDCVTELKKYLKSGRQEKKEPYVGIIHRLDEPVEGVLLFAKNEKAAAKLSLQMQKGAFVKKYRAAVISKNNAAPAGGVLTDHILKDPAANRSKVVDAGTKGAKEAELEYTPAGEYTNPAGDRIYLLDITLFTGRHHQIRVQLENDGYPIVGDRKYGKELCGLPLCLAATELSFDHPVSGKRMDYRIVPVFIDRLKSSGFDI